MHTVSQSSPKPAVDSSLSALPAAQGNQAAAANPQNRGWRKVTCCALALGGVALATYRNHGASCPLWRSILSYAAWQVPAVVYYLGTKPTSMAWPVSVFARQLQSDMKKELGIPEKQGIGLAVSAVWLIAPPGVKSNPGMSQVTHVFEHDQLKESVELTYPRDQSGSRSHSLEGFNEFLARRGLERVDQFVIPTALASQSKKQADSTVDEKALRQAFADQASSMQELSMHLADSAPLDKLMAGDSFVCLMAGEKDSKEGLHHHIVTISRIADSLVIFDPEVGLSIIVESDDACRVKLEELECLHQKKTYHFLRYRPVDSNDSRTEPTP